MTAQEIRNLETDSDLEDRRGQFRNVFLQEIAAQLAEFNQLAKRRDEKFNEVISTFNTTIKTLMERFLN